MSGTELRAWHLRCQTCCSVWCLKAIHVLAGSWRRPHSFLLFACESQLLGLPGLLPCPWHSTKREASCAPAGGHVCSWLGETRDEWSSAVISDGPGPVPACIEDTSVCVRNLSRSILHHLLLGCLPPVKEASQTAPPVRACINRQIRAVPRKVASMQMRLLLGGAR